MGSIVNPPVAHADYYNGYNVASIQRHLNNFREARNSNWIWWDNVKFSKLVVDGKYGSKTRAAVEEYQSKNGLYVDGIVGRDTWAKLSHE
ncbi:peptidoglycan-binding protein [Listeria sp. FSL L7-1582]|nr:peptidoglycan-binding protein [Listeria portnoyi]